MSALHPKLKAEIEKRLDDYFGNKVKLGVLTEEEAEPIKAATHRRIIEWLENSYIPSKIRKLIKDAIEEGRWDDLVFAFWQEITFGTSGIRGRAALTEQELVELHSKGLHANLLKGPNTINDVVFTIFTGGVANYMKRRGMEKVVLGFDSRIRGREFTELIASIFLPRGFTVYMFDEASPYPELSFAVTHLKADIGIEISASHNDKRYNGYKIASRTGASLTLRERDDVIAEIYGSEDSELERVHLRDIKTSKLQDPQKGKLIYLGGDRPLYDIGQSPFINMHQKYLNQIQTFLLRQDVIERFAPKVKIGFSAYYGSGCKTIPWLLREAGFTSLKIVSELNELNGLFPAFGLTQIVDPGYIGSAKIAVEKFKEEHGEEAFRELDMLIGTDPDADRMGLIVNVPEEYRQVYGDWKLLTADDVWTLLLWYQLSTVAERNGGVVPEVQRKFIVKSHVTTEALPRVAQKFGVDCIGTPVGFSFLAGEIIKQWNQGKINIGAFEQSNGFSIGGAKPELGEPLGKYGHTLEKDGTLAAILVAEIAAFAKAREVSILDLLNDLYLDPDIAFFATTEVSLPEEGVFEGVEGEMRKRQIIRNIERMAELVPRQDVRDFETMAEVPPETEKGQESNHSLEVAGLPIRFAHIFLTGKYDSQYWPDFPDEGLRFHFDSSGYNHFTIRPSGTEAKLRFYVQYQIEGVTKQNIWEKRAEAERFVDRIARESISYVTSRQF